MFPMFPIYDVPATHRRAALALLSEDPNEPDRAAHALRRAGYKVDAAYAAACRFDHGFMPWRDQVMTEAAGREFHIATDDRRLFDCYSAGFDAYDTVDGFIDEACAAASLHARCPLY